MVQHGQVFKLGTRSAEGRAALGVQISGRGTWIGKATGRRVYESR